MLSIPDSSSSASSAAGPAPPLLDVQDLRVHFLTRAGAVRAVDGVDYSVGAKETLGLVGEFGQRQDRLEPRAAAAGTPSRQSRGRDVCSSKGTTSWRGRRRR